MFAADELIGERAGAGHGTAAQRVKSDHALDGDRCTRTNGRASVAATMMTNIRTAVRTAS